MPDYFIPQLAANAPGNPMWFPEFQGGSLANPGDPVGFEGCYTLTGPSFVNVCIGRLICQKLDANTIPLGILQEQRRLGIKSDELLYGIRRHKLGVSFALI